MGVSYFLQPCIRYSVRVILSSSDTQLKEERVQREYHRHLHAFAAGDDGTSAPLLQNLNAKTKHVKFDATFRNSYKKKH